MAKVSVAGATGYTGFELVRLLMRHPETEIISLTSETYAGKCISEVFPALKGWIEQTLIPLGSELPPCDFLFLALPHTESMRRVQQFLENGIKIIDLSADFRLRDPRVFEQWYGATHLKPNLLDSAVYGLPELHRQQIKSAQLVANPGCYPTSIILGLAPLMVCDWIDRSTLIADSKSGISGAGRKSNLATQYAECNDAISAYNIGDHRHTPEIEQELSSVAGQDIRLTFSPHLAPMTRGILSTIYVNLKHSVSVNKILECYETFYQGEPFVHILKSGNFAGTRHVNHSNVCHIGIQVDTRTNRVVITSAIDNLVKGASGQAVQNMNIMLGVKETVGLDTPGLCP
tara:strand:+ start:445 stop:1479 length:1035 start_codon:yes stop_codon:yes gene_type:complete